MSKEKPNDELRQHTTGRRSSKRMNPGRACGEGAEADRPPELEERHETNTHQTGCRRPFGQSKSGHSKQVENRSAARASAL